jgi:hypothetical protein
MHTQTESTQVHRRSRAISPGAVSGLALYLLTISGEALPGLPPSCRSDGR